MYNLPEKKFREYDWKVFLNDIPEEVFMMDEDIRIKSVKRFADQFSPMKKRGLLKRTFKGTEFLKRKKNDAIDFIVKTGLIQNEEKAKRFIDYFKNKLIIYFNFPGRGNYKGEYFQLTEFRNKKGESAYLAEAKSLFGLD